MVGTFSDHEGASESPALKCKEGGEALRIPISVEGSLVLFPIPSYRAHGLELRASYEEHGRFRYLRQPENLQEFDQFQPESVSRARCETLWGARDPYRSAVITRVVTPADFLDPDGICMKP